MIITVCEVLVPMLEQETISRIRILLKAHPRGLTITEVSQNLKMNRNSAAKYLEILQISGLVEFRSYGTARVFFLSPRLPVSALVSIGSDLVVTLDDNHRILFVNDGFCNLFAVKKEDIAGSHVVDVFRTGIGSDVLPGVFSDIIAGNEEVHEVRLPRDTGDLFFKIKSMKTVFDDGSRGITILMEDVTREKRDRIELEVKEARYRGIVEDQIEYVIRFLPDGMLSFVNSSYSRFQKKEPEDLLGTPFSDTIHPQDRDVFNNSLNILDRKKPVTSFECRSALPAQTACWISWTLRVMYGDRKEPVEYQAVGYDITEKKEAAEKIQQQVTQMEFFSKKLQQFIELPPGADIYQVIGNGFSEILPVAAICVSSYDPATASLIIKAVCAEHDKEVLTKYIGRDIIGLKVPANDVRPGGDLLSGQIYRRKGNLFDIICHQVPKATCDAIEKTLNLGEYFSVGLTWRGALLGAVTFSLRNAGTLDHKSFGETYVRAASIALQRSLAEDARRRSDEIFSNLAQYSPFPIALIEPDHVFRYINDSFIRIFGYDLDDFRTLEELLPLMFPDPVYRKTISEDPDWKQAMSRIGNSVTRTYRVRCNDSSVKDIVVRGVILSGGMVCTLCEDLTERNKAEQTHRLLSSIITSTSDAVIAKDTRGTIISWNRAAELLYGYSADEMVGQHISRIVPAERAEETETIFSRIALGESVSNLETRRMRKDGRVIDVSLTISPLVDDTGTVTGASTIARDITSHKAEEYLKESENQYRALVENISVGFYRSSGDPTGHFIWGNSSLVNILGYPSLEQLKEVGITDIFVEHDGRKRLLDALKKEGFVKNREIALRRADGETISVLVTALARFDTGGNLSCVNGIVEDITRQKRAELQMQIAYKEMQDILACIPDPVVIVDSKNIVLAWNAAMEQLTGVQKTGAIGRNDCDRLFPFYDPTCPALFTLFDASDVELNRYYPGAYRDGTAIVAQVRDKTQKEDPLSFFTLRAFPLRDPEDVRIGAMQIIRSPAPEGRNRT